MPSAIMKAEIAEAPTGKGQTQFFQEASGQSFKAGQYVKLVSGYLTICAGSAAASTEPILGIAQKDATGTQYSLIPVALCEPGVKIRMSVYHVTPGSAITAQASVGSQTQFIQTGNKSCVDVANIGASANAPLVIGEIDSQWATGTAYGKYLVQVRADRYQLAA